jgi:hypothetical protein
MAVVGVWVGGWGLEGRLTSRGTSLLVFGSVGTGVESEDLFAGPLRIPSLPVCGFVSPLQPHVARKQFQMASLPPASIVTLRLTSRELKRSQKEVKVCDTEQVGRRCDRAIEPLRIQSMQLSRMQSIRQ